MENVFIAVMAKKTDAELIDIVTGPASNYQAVAFEAAQKEFQKRNLSNELIEAVKQDIDAIQEIKNNRANEPLDSGIVVLAILLPGLIPLFFSGAYKIDGYHRKAKELVRYTMYGFGFYVGLVCLFAILH